MTFDEYLLTGFSVFAGAAAAFILTELKSVHKSNQSKYKAGTYAQFLLATQYNALAAYRKNNLQEYTEHKEREFLVKPTPPSIPNELIDFSSINFLIEQKFRRICKGRFANLLLRLQVVQECYCAMINGINQRSSVHLKYQDELQEVMARRKEQGKKVTDEDFLIQPYASQLKDLTNNIYECIDDYIKDMVAINIELGEAIRHGLMRDH